ncbi:MAG: hypothetical protein ACI9R3_000813 [Verrucomicrobiales bacterium]|jgi:hypothetical protein
MKFPDFSASLVVVIVALMFSSPGHSEEQSIVVSPGENTPLGIVIFPPALIGNSVVDAWTVADIFGPQNEAGLMAALNPELADIIEIPGPNGNLRPVFFHSSNGWQFADDNGDAANYLFPISTGMIFQRTGPDPLQLIFQGQFRQSPIDVLLQPGRNLINRTFAQPFTLGSIEPDLVAALNRNDDLFLADIVEIPDQALQLFLDSAGQWRNVITGDLIDPHTVEIGAVFEIFRQNAPANFPFFPQERSPAIELPPQDLAEGSPGRLNGVGFDSIENICLVGVGERLVPLRVAQAIGDGDLIFQPGKIPESLSVEGIGISRGAGVIAPVEIAANFEFRDPVWTFQSNMPLAEQVPFVETIEPEPSREGEFRYFSSVEDGSLVLNAGAPDTWPEGTLVDLTFLAFFESGSKLALNSSRIRLRSALSRNTAMVLLGQFLASTLGERGIIDERAIEIDSTTVAGGEHQLSITFPDRIADGLFDVCVQIPPPPPIIDSVTGSIVSDGIIVIEGSGFGDRPDDLCVALVGEDGNADPISIAVRALAITNGGTRLFAEITGKIDDARPLRMMMNRGRGVTRRFILGFPDVIQNQGIWVWESLGVESVHSPAALSPALAFDNEICSRGTLAGGSLRNTLPSTWPEHARVRVSFTANSRDRMLDYYAQDLCFTVDGTTEDCAERIRGAIGSAFIQEGMANGNELSTQTSTSDEGATTVVASLFTGTGALDPITDGHFNVCYAEDAQCDIPELEDDDGDGLHDDWEERFFGEDAEDVDPDSDPDLDNRNTRGEFAFSSDPLVFDSRQVEGIFIDSLNRPAISYFQHETGSRAFHYSLETSTNAGIWQSSPSFDIRVSRLGSERVRVIATSKLTTEQLGSSLLRVRATPRLP